MVIDALLQAVESGAAVLTANNRVSRALRHAYTLRQRDTGLGAWRSPEILPWAAWLGRAWEEAVYAGRTASLVLLSPDQEQAVWERVIEEDPEGGTLLQLRETARQAAAAWELVEGWRLDLEDPAWEGHADAQAFRRWAAAFASLCEREGWLESARLPGRIAACFRDGSVRAPNRLLLIGFDEFTPGQTELWKALEAAGCLVEMADLSIELSQAAAGLVGLAGAEEEIRTAARWARRLVEGEAGRIGVIIPDLPRVRPAVDRIFRDVLYPGQAAVDPRRSCYNISLGLPLADYPLVSLALEILEMAPDAAPLATVGRLLRSPFLAGAQVEWTARCQLEARLAGLGDVEVDFASIAELGARCSRFVSALGAWRQARRSLDETQTPSQWAAGISRLLASFGWPGDRSLDSVEYQTMDRWRELLSAFAALDRVVGALRLSPAIRRLRAMAAEAQFQPLQRDAPIQVLGVFEASGMRFDHLWVMGMHDEAWPEPPSPNPLLPIALQREHRLPHSSAERELAFARQVLERLFASAADVVVSWPRREGDRDLRPSPLVRHLAPVDSLELASGESLADRVRAASEMQWLEDWSAPAVAVESWSRGGAKVFQFQATCPFRAFAELRLGAGQPEHPQPGLDPRLRGTLLHIALERLWKEIGSHAQLLSLGEDARHGLVAAAVAAAIQEKCARRRLPKRFLELEQARLEELLEEWLAIEAMRAPFTVVAREEKREVELAGVKLRVKVDRIDQLADGRLVILDYKSGEPDIREWFGDRPGEPQVPLYTVTDGGEPAALAFARVRRGNAGFAGIAGEEDILPKVGQSLEPIAEQVRKWRSVLAGLAGEFLQGRAPADPKNGQKTCAQCHLAALCRIQELLEGACN